MKLFSPSPTVTMISLFYMSHTLDVVHGRHSSLRNKPPQNQEGVVNEVVEAGSNGSRSLTTTASGSCGSDVKYVEIANPFNIQPRVCTKAYRSRHLTIGEARSGYTEWYNAKFETVDTPVASKHKMWMKKHPTSPHIVYIGTEIDGKVCPLYWDGDAGDIKNAGFRCTTSGGADVTCSDGDPFHYKTHPTVNNGVDTCMFEIGIPVAGGSPCPLMRDGSYNAEFTCANTNTLDNSVMFIAEYDSDTNYIASYVPWEMPDYDYGK